MLANGNALDQMCWQRHIDVGKHELDAQGFVFLIVQTKRTHRIFVIWTCRHPIGWEMLLSEVWCRDGHCLAYVQNMKSMLVELQFSPLVFILGWSEWSKWDLIWTAITVRRFCPFSRLPPTWWCRRCQLRSRSPTACARALTTCSPTRRRRPSAWPSSPSSAWRSPPSSLASSSLSRHTSDLRLRTRTLAYTSI